MCKIKILIFSFLGFFSTLIIAADLKFKQLGFEIDALSASADSNYVILNQFLPTKYGFSANVNVTLQQFNLDLSKYALISEKQFKEAGMEILKKNKDKQSLTYEYSGIIKGVKLHFYSKAYKKADRIYLITATELEENWKRQGAILKKTVDSFRFLK